MTVYLCYDLKGIQSFVFRIPRLKYIVGGSALLDRFDRETVWARKEQGARHIFSGGGRGAFECVDEGVADRLATALAREAHRIGADIAFGRDADYSEAAHCASRLYPCLPHGPGLEGDPCPESALFPVKDRHPHPLVACRTYQRGEQVWRRYENELREGVEGCHPLLAGRAIDFFHDVNPDSEAPGDEAQAAALALGGRNRWAVIAMDGNDMGSQFRLQHEARLPQGQLFEWLQRSSKELDDATRGACRDGVRRVVAHWVSPEILERASLTDGTLLLPVRPLIVGGDDLILLCHVRHAFTFVREVARSFESRTEQANEAWKAQHGGPLWPATGGRLTISAGILFVPVSLPLATAVAYAESLLANAKTKGRKLQPEPGSGKPAPACVDWESVTSSVLDHPALARQRDWRFEDRDLGEIVSLTRRPYTMDELAALEVLSREYEGIPTTIRHQVGEALRAGYWDRQVWRARLGKHQAKLAQDLAEPEAWDRDKPCGRWRREKHGDAWERSTPVLDALDLLIEAQRMSQKTVEARP